MYQYEMQKIENEAQTHLIHNILEDIKKKAQINWSVLV